MFHIPPLGKCFGQCQINPTYASHRLSLLVPCPKSCEGRFTPWTMKSEHERWPNSMVQLLWSNFLNNQFTKPLGPSLGVNLMWTTRNDHAPKSECVDVFLICAQKGQFQKNSSLTILLSSLLFLFSSPNKISLKFYYNNNFCHAPPLAFFLSEHLFCLSHLKPIEARQWIM